MSAAPIVAAAAATTVGSMSAAAICTFLERPEDNAAINVALQRRFAAFVHANKCANQQTVSGARHASRHIVSFAAELHSGDLPYVARHNHPSRVVQNETRLHNRPLRDDARASRTFRLVCARLLRILRAIEKPLK